MGKVRHIAVFICLIGFVSSHAQEKVKYDASKGDDGTLEFIKIDGEKVHKFVNVTNFVVFTQGTTTVHCDSAFFYRKRNAMQAFGRVKIVDDSVTITARKLYYDGNTRRAELRRNVVYTKGITRLTTHNLDYDVGAEISHYFNGGELNDTTNTLASEIGYFYAKENFADFKNDVVLTAPDYVLKSNELHYDTRTKIATTPNATEIIAENGSTTLHSDGGEFRTVKDQSLFVDGKLETPNNFLEGDDLFFDKLNKYYKAEGNVKLIAKDKDIIIIGDEGYNDKTNTISKIYGNPVMKRVMENDTFYISADTLVYIESDMDSLKRVLAYSDVKIFKQNLQGLADSLVYYLSDSLIYMYENPILWNKNSQIEGDTIQMEISENTIKRMFLRKNSFMANEDTIKNYNQIKGRYMTANFVDGNIDNVNVNGNGEVIYYLLASGDSLVMGMNRILCSHLKLEFEKGNLSQIRAYVKPEARLIPPHELTVDVQKLDGFLWQGELRPTLDEVLSTSPAEPNPKLQQKPQEGILQEGILSEIIEEVRPEGLQTPKKVKKRNKIKQ